MKSKLISNNPWFSQIPKTWNVLTLQDVCTEIVDNRGKTVPTSESGIPLIATNCIKNEKLFPTYENVRYVSKEIHKNWFRGHPKPGDIIFVNKGTPGRVCFVPDPIDFCIAQDMVSLRVNEDLIYPKFLFAVLRSKFFQTQVDAYFVGTMIPHLKKSTFDELLIPMPSQKIQKIIGDIYYRLSLQISNFEKINFILEQIAQAIFKSWFVDFDGVTEFVDSELGKIPKGWKVNSLDQIATFLNGLSLQNFRSTDNKFLPVIKIREMKNGLSENTEKARTDIESKYIVNNGDVLFSWSGTLELMIWALGKGALNQHIFKVTSEKYYKWFCYLWIKHHLEEFRRIAEGKVTTMGHIQKHHLSEALVLIPQDNNLIKMNKRMSPFFEEILKNKIIIENLIQIRNMLLKKLMSGEIRV